MNYKYRVKRPYFIIYMVLLCIGFLLTIGRWYSVFNSDFVVIHKVIHAHISNFSLSLIVYLGIGYSWLLFGTKFRYIILLGILLMIGNFLCETVMGFMNTTDIIDALYGTVGVFIGFIYLFFTSRYGLLEKEIIKE